MDAKAMPNPHSTRTDSLNSGVLNWTPMVSAAVVAIIISYPAAPMTPTRMKVRPLPTMAMREIATTTTLKAGPVPKPNHLEQMAHFFLGEVVMLLVVPQRQAQEPARLEHHNGDEQERKNPHLTIEIFLPLPIHKRLL